MDVGLSYVLGVDLSPGEVAEAARRFEEAKAKRAKGGGGGGGGGSGGRGQQRAWGSELVAEFRECSTLGLEPFSAEPPPPPPGEGVGGDANGNGEGEASRRKERKSSCGGDEGGEEEADGNDGERKTSKRRRKRRRFDSVSCMFAAHYFCSSDAALSTFLGNVARNLRPVRSLDFVLPLFFSLFLFWGL